MIIDGISPLYQSMKDQNIERYRFKYRHGQAIFDVFFFIDDSPFVLLFGACGHNLSFEFYLLKGFVIEKIYIEEKIYKRLCQILALQYNPNNPFSPKAFLQEFNKHIPSHAIPANKAQPHEIILYRRDVEESDKVYFWGWLNNDVRGGSVTAKNLEKTRKLLGVKAYEICKLKNISSRWTDNSSKASEFYLPN